MTQSIDKSYRITNSGGVSAHRAVVRAVDPAACQLPAAANAGAFLGITTHVQNRTGRLVAVRRSGFAVAEAAGVITVGAPVAIADALGRVRAIPDPRFAFGTVGANTAITIDFLQRPLFAANLTIDFIAGTGTVPFSWTTTPGRIAITLSANSSVVSQTANSLRLAVEADAVLSRLLRVTNVAGSSGTGLLAAASLVCNNLADQLNPIALADEAATAAGDLIAVQLL
jgi:hypothetical protein